MPFCTLQVLQSFHTNVIRIGGSGILEVSSDTGYQGKVLFADSAYDILLKRGMFAFKNQKIEFGAMDKEGTEVQGKTGIYQYNKQQNILVRKAGDGTGTVLAGIQTDTYGCYIVPDGITAVDGGAFAEVDGLEEIKLPSTATELKEGSLVLPDSVERVVLSADKTKVSPKVFGEGAKVPDMIVCVPEKYYDAYLEDWSLELNPVYGEGTAERLLQADDHTIFYEDGAKYQKVGGDGAEQYRLLKVYAQGKTSVAVKEGTTEIDAGAFALCGSLEILYLPDTVQMVEDRALACCKNLQTVTVKEAQILSGDVFDPSGDGVNVYGKGGRFDDFIYEKGSIYGKALDGSYTLIDVPTDYEGDFVLYENTASLADEAFKNCTLLKQINIPDQEALTEIGNRCFENCTGLESVYFSNASRLETVGDEVFRSCTNLKRLYLPDHLNEVGEGLCYDCTSLWSMSAKGISRVGGKMFYNCQSLLSNFEEYLLLDWDEMTAIEDYAFAYCSRLTFIPDMPKLETMGDWAFFTCQRLNTVALPENLTLMGEECFGACSSLTQVEMNGKLSGISRYCFNGCSKLVKIEFSEQQKNALEFVGVRAFGQCASLESLDLSDFPSLCQMGERAFAGCDLLTTARLPENLLKVPDYCFENCPNLSFLSIRSDNVPELGKAVFGDTLAPFVRIWVKVEKVSDYWEAYKDILDQTYGEGTTGKILGGTDTNKEIVRGITYEFTDEGRILNEVSEAFEGDYTVPIDTVRIKAGAFMDCDKLTGLTLPDDSSIILEDRCFEGCTNLERVELYGNIPQWGEDTFMGCTSLKELEIGGGAQDQVPRVGARAFKGCTGLEGQTVITFRAEMPVLGEECFAGCINLGAISMTASARTGIEVIENRVFEGCTNLTQFLSSSFTGVKTIGDYAFSDCDSLANPSVPPNVESVGEGAYSECDKLQTVSFYCELEEYPKDCFKNSPKLTRTGGVAKALSGLKRIGEGVYEGCSSLTTNAN